MAYVTGMGGWWDDFLRYNSPSTWGSAIADVYQRAQYGTIPAPGAGLPSPPVPAAPANDQMDNWSPAAAGSATAKSFENWVAAMRQAIVDAEQSGEYNPSGNLPVDADWMGKYGGWIAGAAAVGVVLVLVSGARR